MAKGYKTCKQCKTVVKGVRTLVCPKCNAEFTTAKVDHYGKDLSIEGERPTAPQHIVPDLYKGMIQAGTQLVYAPAGSCPRELHTLDDESVADWAHVLRLGGLQQRKFYTNDALASWANYQYPQYTEDGELLAMVIRDLPDIKLAATA